MLQTWHCFLRLELIDRQNRYGHINLLPSRMLVNILILKPTRVNSDIFSKSKLQKIYNKINYSSEINLSIFDIALVPWKLFLV